MDPDLAEFLNRGGLVLGFVAAVLIPATTYGLMEDPEEDCITPGAPLGSLGHGVRLRLQRLAWGALALGFVLQFLSTF